MELLRTGDSNVIKIIQKNTVDPQQEYRLSKWVFLCETDDSVALRSTLSKRVYRLDPAEWAAVCGGDRSLPAFSELAKQRFLVETSFDDNRQYSLVLAVLRGLERRKRGTDSFTILPTTGCNARCTYCYQDGLAVRTMTPEIADRTAEYICAVKWDDPIDLTWFGGEPLCASPVISRICAVLRERGVEYRSSIVTNGSLFAPDLIREAVELWHLERAQVSMDGAREDYEKRKRYLDPARHNYDIVMAAVDNLAAAGVKVIIRCNYDLENLPGVYRFLDECEERFSQQENVRVKVAGLLHLLHSPVRTPEAAQQFQALSEYLEKKGMRRNREPTQRLKSHQCMADSGGASVIIDPAGGLHTCDNYIGGEPLGSIFDEKQPVWPRLSEPAEECRNCCFLPDCTPVFKKQCPFCPSDCRERSIRGGEYTLRKMLGEIKVPGEIPVEEDTVPCI